MARACRHCSEPLDWTAMRCPECRQSDRTYGTILFLAIAAIAVLLAMMVLV